MTKEELLQYRNLKLELMELEEKIREVRESVMYPAGKIITDMPIAPHNDTDKMAEIMAKIDELEREYINKYSECLNQTVAIEHAIQGLSNASERRLMRFRYLQCLSWKVIAADMNISVRTAHRIHSAALYRVTGGGNFGKESGTIG
jgi:DNA-directed RNA polymerase specialized sigma subunit